MDYVLFSGFNNGMLSVADHTRLQDILGQSNYIGIRMDHAQNNVFGDEYWDRVYLTGNAWAALSLDKQVFFNGIMQKPHFAYNPYAIWFEPAFNNSTAIQGTEIFNPNFEACGQGVIKDGSIRDGFYASAAIRTMLDVEITAPYWGQDVAYRSKANQPWGGYIDIFGTYGVTIKDIFDNTFGTAIANIPLIRISRIDNFVLNRGGLHLEGSGLWSIIQTAATNNVEIVGGAGGLGCTFVFTGGYNAVTLECADWRAKPFIVSDAGLGSGLPNGTVMEFGTTAINGHMATQRAGLGSDRPIVGVSIQPWTTNPTSLRLTIIAVAGSRLPVLTTFTAAATNMLKVDSATPGSVKSATGMSDAPIVGITESANNSSSAYIKTLFPGGW